jgi:hypothetical protein
MPATTEIAAIAFDQGSLVFDRQKPMAILIPIKIRDCQ